MSRTRLVAVLVAVLAGVVVSAQNPVSISQVGTTPVTTTVPVSGTVTVNQTGAASNLLARVEQRAAIGAASTLLSAVTANTTGTAWTAITGYRSASLLIDCSSCAGGTAVSWEVSTDGLNFIAAKANLIGTTTIATSTTTAGVTLWFLPLTNVTQLRANVSAYSAGTITVTGLANPISASPLITDVNVIGTVPVSGTFWQATQPVSGTFWQATQPVSGTFWQATQPVSGTVTANLGTIAGVSTAAKQPALGTAGTASADVITIQGIASMTKLLVTPDSVALPANQSVNVAQMNGVAVTMGAGATGTGVQRTNDVASAATGAAPPAAGAFIAGLGSGATGGLLLGITVCDTPKAVTISTATTALIVTGVSGRHVRICNWELVTAGANNVAWLSGTGATCGTGSAGMAGGTTAASGYNLAANGGVSKGNGIGEVLRSVATGDSVCLITSAATQLSGSLYYAIY